ncbi:DUF1439 domain-containing protein [Cupriavidus sp. USMAA2-4]|uniref:DUF1439 domain-containing protein n=1 Tax=Cupriavidus malaysiensis TaxID=367825 RepID=A0ABM6F6V8_9BURK|nr:MULTISPECIES: DUF1439 domain-containing protein [Cupriavidus]AOY93036.1 DUF1439 domain-containing protein [Cupriavidus sp. USMAA2-4]AOZ00560.1 DUF1439 domain-containing protein [Cupriavidus sp. USMAHM13]AOZ07307.1 DUF1439 domain-containing protein [Cupriavidus malaysiensis]
MIHFNRRRWMAATLTAAAAGLAVWLGGCAGIGSDYTFSQAQLQAALERKFPFNKRYMELFDIQLAHPQLLLDPQRNRVSVQFDATVDNRLFFNQPLKGRFALDSGLRYDQPTRSLVLQDPQVQQFDVAGLPGQFSRQLNALGAILAEQLLQGYPLYTFKPEQLRLAGTEVEPGTITVLPNGINVKINRP